MSYSAAHAEHIGVISMSQRQMSTTAYPRHQLVGRQHPVDPLGVFAQDDGHLLGQLVHSLGGDLVLGQVGVQI